MKLLRDCPLLVGIGTTAIILSVISFAFKDTAYADVGSGEEGPDEPAIARVFKAASMGIYPWTTGEEPDESLSTEEIPPVEENEPGDGASNESSPEEVQQEDADISGNSSFDLSGNDGAFDVSGNSAEDEVYEFTDVDDDYFTDALFIGDSRTVGLSEYCEALDTRATFYAKVSLTIYDCMTKDFIKTDDGKMNLEEALTKQQYGKIYIMLGINEIGTGNEEYFKNAYSEVIDKIRELQPDAIIYIQGIMHVTKAKSSVDKFFNNGNIDARNAAIAELADNHDIFYIDMNEAVDDGEGNLDGSLTFDDVHLKASSYERWHEFLLHNGIIR